MLEELLAILRQGEVQTYTDLARKLNVSEALLEGMLAELQRMGYLRLVNEHCSGHCQGCSLSGVCAIGGQGRIWSLTEKGAKALGGDTAAG